jgi:hypothetical protein
MFAEQEGRCRLLHACISIESQLTWSDLGASHTMPYDAMRYDTIRCDTNLLSTLLCFALLCSAMPSAPCGLRSAVCGVHDT